MFLMVHDSSHAKAIIKRAITDYEEIYRRRASQLDRQLALKKSKGAVFKLLISEATAGMQGCLLYHHLYRHQIFKRETHYFYFLNLEAIVQERAKRPNFYPSVFSIDVMQIDSKTFLHEGGYSLPFGLIAAHCLERVLQRSGALSLPECLKVLNPIWIPLQNLVLMFRNVLASGRFILYFTEGYVVLGIGEHQLPIVLTWLPCEWFSEDQIVKFYNLDLRKQRYFLIREQDFNTRKVLSQDDCLLRTGKLSKAH
jgi:hypothetical protein